MDKSVLQARLEFRKSVLIKLYQAYEALVSGGVKSYTIDNRQLTKLDLPALKREINAAEAEIDQLSKQISAGRPRKAFGIVPMDW